jgi:superfamily II DNA or RNA helicase
VKLTLEPYQQVMRDHLLTHDRAYACVGLGLGKTATSHARFAAGTRRSSFSLFRLT